MRKPAEERRFDRLALVRCERRQRDAERLSLRAQLQGVAQPRSGTGAMDLPYSTSPSVAGPRVAGPGVAGVFCVRPLVTADGFVMGRDFAKFRAGRKVGAFPSLKPARLRLLPPAASVAGRWRGTRTQRGSGAAFP